MSDLKNYIIEYTGNRLASEDGEVTAEMVIEVLAQEFPEIVLLMAEENWIRGYEQGLEDIKQFDGEE